MYLCEFRFAHMNTTDVLDNPKTLQNNDPAECKKLQNTSNFSESIGLGGVPYKYKTSISLTSMVGSVPDQATANDPHYFPVPQIPVSLVFCRYHLFISYRLSFDVPGFWKIPCVDGVLLTPPERPAVGSVGFTLWVEAAEINNLRLWCG